MLRTRSVQPLRRRRVNKATSKHTTAASAAVTAAVTAPTAGESEVAICTTNDAAAMPRAPAVTSTGTNPRFSQSAVQLWWRPSAGRDAW